MAGGIDANTPFKRALVLAMVTMATTLYGTTVLVVSVILPQMQGSLSATQDQIAWVMTFNILATAIATPMTGWLTARFGRRKVMIYCQAGFTLATLFCGLADSLEVLVLFRVAQGALGAPLIPLAQATILDTYPKSQHGKATSIFGMGVVIGPVLGPIVGGYLADVYTWRYAFYMIVPVGTAAVVGLYFLLSDKGRQSNVKLDWTGFLALAIGIGCVQLMMDRGQRQDWFQSIEIVLEAAVGVLAFYVFVAHSVTTRRPFLTPSLLLDRNYALGLMIVFIYGMLNFTPMVLFPPMLQGLMGYPNSVIGELLGARGIGALGGFFSAMFVSRIDPRIGMLIGMGIQATSGLIMMSFDQNVSFNMVAFVGALQGLSVGLFWVPLTVAAFSTLNPAYLAESSAIFHLLRNLGSSIFISLSVATVISSRGANYARMTEFASPFNENLEAAGMSLDTVQGIAGISGEILRQASMLGYLNAFALYTAACLASVPLILMFRVAKRTPSA
ncbi:MAG: DHA2 family efflux MFS transporter permease subunit [Alphaproteobacteria bacterium]|nr:DHA2 family efflux MFS transporter permease subunit [Alphaproteobacteria bacterium]MCB9929984.1 DHA2 family efflux MFS transporter permease subunit [Alphaproteobacteria bacterium]